MAEWLKTLRGALLFDSETFRQFHARPDVFLRGALLIVVVALLASLPTFVVDLVDALRVRPPASDQMGQASAQFDRALQRALPLLGNMPPATRDVLVTTARQGFETAAEISARIQALPTPIPQPIGRGLQALGRWLSRPFGSGLPLAAATLGTWLGYGIWVMLFARLLGGKGDLAGFFGATSLFAAPHLLNILSLAPAVGPAISFIAFVWGLALYVKATATSHALAIERALLAVVLPFLILIVLLLIAVFGLATVIGIAVGGR